MSGYERNTMRALGASELEQIGGGCPGGANCDCPGTKQWTAGASAFGPSVFFQNCAGYVYENGKRAPLSH